MRHYHRDKGDPILPLGVTNLTTGYSPSFNLYEAWDLDDSTAEIWKTGDDKYVLVITAGNTPIYNVGDFNTYKHDQTWRRLFYSKKEYSNWVEMVDWATLRDLPGKAAQYGNRLRAYVYK